jgi:integrase
VFVAGKRRANHEGTIFKDSSRNLWISEIYVEGQKKRKTSKTQAVVKDWLLEQRKAVKDNTFIFDERTTISQFLDRFMADIVQTTLKPKTVDSYQFLIEHHIKPSLGSYRLTNLKPTHLQALYTEKLAAGLSKRTVQYIHAVLRRALGFAVKWGLLVKNPTDAVQAPTPGKKTPETLTVDQLTKFLAAVKDHRWYPIYTIAIGCGLREGEILGLRKVDVDLINQVIHINQVVNYIAGKLSISTPKTDSSVRQVDMPDFVADVLKEHMQDRPEGLLFTTSTGNLISHRNLLRHFHETLAKLSIPRVKFHSLRHSFASLHLISGTNPKIVQEALGHASITLTLDTYSHIIPTLQKEAAKKMDSIFNVKE